MTTSELVALGVGFLAILLIYEAWTWAGEWRKSMQDQDDLED